MNYFISKAGTAIGVTAIPEKTTMFNIKLPVICRCFYQTKLILRYGIVPGSAGTGKRLELMYRLVSSKISSSVIGFPFTLSMCSSYGSVISKLFMLELKCNSEGVGVW